MSSEETPPTNLFLNEFPDVSSYKDAACSNVVKLIRSSNDLSRANDHDFLMSFAPLRRRMDIIAEKLLQNINSLLKQQNLRRDLGIVSWKEADHDDKIEKLIDMNDILFERISSSLDEAAGLKKTSSEVTTLIPSIRNVPATWNKEIGFVLQENVLPIKQQHLQQKRNNSTFSINHQQTKNIPKPQLKFTDKVDNSLQMPFITKIRTKPNALTPLPNCRSIDMLNLENHPEVSSHPYFDEIEAFEPDANLLKEAEPQLPKSIEETKCLFVDTTDKLKTMLDHIELQSELAVDLEHHSYRSYQGFTCLMQISSRTEDFLIDTILLRDELHNLNNIFTNPNIVKIFHGADSDIEWLQKDFGVYIVNMFDTHQAARELNLPAFSLAYLLKSYCDIDANKQFQLADWRIRPLPEEYLRYAREDTHCLLYIYDLLRNRLLEIRQSNPQLLQLVYEKSKIICQKLYKKPYFDDYAYQNIYSKSRKTFNIRQLAALKSLYYWRDKIARHEDESTGYVLPNHMLLQISEILPREPQGVRACCNPVPLLVQHNLHDIHQIILQVRDIPLIEEPKEQQIAPLTLPALYDPENVLNCPHDTSHQTEQQHSVNVSSSELHTKSKKILLSDLASILDETFIEESNKRDALISSSLPIQIKTQLLPVSKPQLDICTNFFDMYMPESYRTGSVIKTKPFWKVYYPDRDLSIKGRLIQHDTNNQNGNIISKEKSTDDIEVIMLSKQSMTKRKRKIGSDENIGNKRKDKRYRRGCVADEVPSTISLNGDDEEEEEPGEIVDAEQQQTSFQPFNYETNILSNKQFKRPADDEDIYEPNRRKKSSKFKTPRRPGAQQTNKSLSYPFPKKT